VAAAAVACPRPGVRGRELSYVVLQSCANNGVAGMLCMEAGAEAGNMD
jgi:hypothetical protein